MSGNIPLNIFWSLLPSNGVLGMGQKEVLEDRVMINLVKLCLPNLFCNQRKTNSKDSNSFVHFYIWAKQSVCAPCLDINTIVCQISFSLFSSLKFLYYLLCVWYFMHFDIRIQTFKSQISKTLTFLKISSFGSYQ